MRWWPKSEYTKSLEAEVERLRERERELLNRVLAVAGMTPIEAKEEPKSQRIMRGRTNWRDIGHAQVAKTVAAFRTMMPESQAEAEKKANAS